MSAIRKVRTGAAPAATASVYAGAPAGQYVTRVRRRTLLSARRKRKGLRPPFLYKAVVRLSTLARRPALTVLVGAVAIAFSGILFRLAHVSPSTGAFYRCVWALPALWLFAWLLWRERPQAMSLVAIPVVLFGVILISGVVEAGAYGENPALGAVFGVLTGLAYTAFLLALRQGGRGLVGPAGPLFDATLASAVGCAVIGVVVGDLDLTPSLQAQGWLVLLALSSQVVGWLLIAISLPRLPAVV